MSEWNHIIIEAYCCRKQSDKKGKYIYEAESTSPLRFRKKASPYYDPHYKTPKMPSYCPMRSGRTDAPEFVCLEKSCPHLAYCEAEERDKRAMLGAWWRARRVPASEAVSKRLRRSVRRFR